jgi:hypothetical protein
MEETRIEKIKNHLKKHKTTYITGGVCLVVGTAVGVVLSATKVSVGSGQNNYQVGLLNYWFNHSTTIDMPATGNRGEIVFCEETKQLFPSQGIAAKALGVAQGNISKQLNGELNHVGGYHFISLGENLNDEVTMAAV